MLDNRPVPRIRILHLEDDPRDVELVRLSLEGSGLACEIVQVDDRDHYAAKLQEGGFDLILADHGLPSFDGRTAMALARGLQPEVPFVFVSGKMGEDAAISSLVDGATDYVLKSNLKRLPSAVRRALEDAGRRREKRRLDSALRESEEKLRQLVETDQQVYFLREATGAEILYVSPAYEKIWGRSCQSLYEDPKSWMDSVHPDDIERVKAAIADHWLKPMELEFRIIRPDGVQRWILARNSPLEERVGQPRRVCGIAMDITQRKAYESRMAAEHAAALTLAAATTVNEAASGLLKAIGEALEWEVGAFWRPEADRNSLRCLEFWAKRPERVAAFKEATLAAVFSKGTGMPGRVWDSLKTALIPDTGKNPPSERTAAAAEAGLRSVLAIPLIGDKEFLGAIEFWGREIRPPDPNLEKMLESVAHQLAQYIQRRDSENALDASQAQLRQAQKLESIGRLAGGVAHDFNNVLTAIIGCAEFLKGDLAAGQPRPEDLEEIIKSAKRAATLTRQLLAFSRRQVLETRLIDLNALVRDMEPMLRRLIGEDIHLAWVPAQGLRLVKADEGQIEQVLMNLVVNSRDAMPEGGKLSIETANVELDKEYAARHPGVLPGSYVLLAVSDTGSGMDEATRAHLFEPFFTTKEAGKGTGLGLSTVYGIVKQSRGHINFYSEPGRGTSFKVYLPAVEIKELGVEPAPKPAVRRGTETILLVEDEDMVRRVAMRVLRDLGYTVLEAKGGEEAEKIARERRGDIHLVLTDLIMPGVGGFELSKRLASILPKARILLMSGYTDRAAKDQDLSRPGLHYLQKPFTPESLALRVREALD